jgi:aryl carrier-like protein
MVPSTVALLERLPTTPNGKVDRKALATRESGGAPRRSSHSAPRTELERSIATIWKEVLALPEVGINENFFELGGHSLLLLRLQSRLAAAVAEVPVVDLFRYPTVEALATHLANGRGEDHDGMEAARQRAEKQKSRARDRGRMLAQKAAAGDAIGEERAVTNSTASRLLALSGQKREALNALLQRNGAPPHSSATWRKRERATFLRAAAPVVSGSVGSRQPGLQPACRSSAEPPGKRRGRAADLSRDPTASRDTANQVPQGHRGTLAGRRAGHRSGV